MCPLRFVLVFFSALLAGYVAWKSVGGSNDDEDFVVETRNKAKEERQEFNSVELKFPKIIQNGFWVFVDMASGKYLWRNIKSLHNVDKSKSS
ncbi:unnamed protein product [Withania somnifera]